MTNQATLKSIEHGYRMPAPELCTDTIYDMLLLCWAKDPEDRPTFENLHNFFVAFNVSEGEYQ